MESTPTETVAADAPVTEVTLFEDRARVTRQGKTKLSPGMTRVRIEGVAPVLSDASLTADLGPGSEVRVVEARVERRLRVPASAGNGSEVERLRDERESLDEAIASLVATASLLEHQAESLVSLEKLTLSEITEDVSWGRHDEDGWSRRLDTVAEQQRRLEDRLADLRRELAQKREDRRRLQERLSSLEQPSTTAWAAIEVTVESAVVAEVSLRCEYVVPGASWRPYHTARLIEDRGGDGSRLEFRSDGCVWQNTGEDWHRVRLSFSTLRPALGTEPPNLSSDLLTVQKRPESEEVEGRDEEITTIGLGDERAAETPQLPGIDDGGKPLTVLSATTVSVPSDGRPCRVRLTSFQCPAEVTLTAKPELLQAVVLQSVQENSGGKPILAGPVDLVRSGGYAGRTSVLFVAPGERFRLGWGPEPELRVERRGETVQDKPRALTPWESRHCRTTVALSNLGPSTHTVSVTERIPVSEIDRVVVVAAKDETSEGRTPDDNGFLQWKVSLPPFGGKTLQLKYTLKKHQDVKGL